THMLTVHASLDRKLHVALDRAIAGRRVQLGAKLPWGVDRHGTVARMQIDVARINRFGEVDLDAAVTRTCRYGVLHMVDRDGAVAAFGLDVCTSAVDLDLAIATRGGDVDAGGQLDDQVGAWGLPGHVDVECSAMRPSRVAFTTGVIGADRYVVTALDDGEHEGSTAGQHMGTLTMHLNVAAARSRHPDVAVDVIDMDGGTSRNGAAPIERRSIGLSARRSGGEQKDEESSHIGHTGALRSRFQGSLTQISQAHVPAAEEQDDMLPELGL